MEMKQKSSNFSSLKNKGRMFSSSLNFGVDVTGGSFWSNVLGAV